MSDSSQDGVLGQLSFLLRREGLLVTRLVFVARNELVADGRELLIENSRGSKAPLYHQGNIYAIGRNEEAVYCISAPAPVGAAYARVRTPLHWVRVVPVLEWKTHQQQQTPEQLYHLDDLFETAGSAPGWWLQS